MFAYPVALLLFVVTWVVAPRVPRILKALVGVGVVALAVSYLVTEISQLQPPTDERTLVVVVGGLMLLGGFTYVVAQVVGRRSVSTWLEILGLALIGAVFILPSTLVLGLPVVAMLMAVAIQDARRGPQESGGNLSEVSVQK